MAQYTTEFKTMVAKRNETAKTYTETAREYGLQPKQVKEWSQAWQKYGELAFEEDGPRRFEEKRNRELERENADLKEELAIIKKAMAFFSRSDLR